MRTTPTRRRIWGPSFAPFFEWGRRPTPAKNDPSSERRPRRYFDDGVHPSEEGHARMARRAEKSLREWRAAVDVGDAAPWTPRPSPAPTKLRASGRPTSNPTKRPSLQPGPTVLPGPARPSRPPTRQPTQPPPPTKRPTARPTERGCPELRPATVDECPADGEVLFWSCDDPFLRVDRPSGIDARRNPYGLEEDAAGIPPPQK